MRGLFSTYTFPVIQQCKITEIGHDLTELHSNINWDVLYGPHCLVSGF